MFGSRQVLRIKPQLDMSLHVITNDASPSATLELNLYWGRFLELNRLQVPK